MKIDSILIFEPPTVQNLYPFSILHCAWEVRVGTFRIFERLKRLYPQARMLFKGREKHLASFFARFPQEEQNVRRENLLIYNASVLPSQELKAEIDKKYKDFVQTNGEKAVIFFTSFSANIQKPFAFYIPEKEQVNPNNFDKDYLPALLNNFPPAFHRIEIDAPKAKDIEFLWHPLDHNSFAIEDDFQLYNNYAEFDSLRQNGVSIINQTKVKIGLNSKIAPGVVIDAEDGAVIIDDDVKIMANSYLQGPLYIGKNSLIKAGAKIYEGTSFGEFCKVGGEVENSIIHSYSNKQHDGFLGHSYIGEWVNLGADTNTSDLKNTYSEIKVLLEDYEINTRRIFLGLLCGDHTKSSINAMFTTGTVAGICGIIVRDWFMPNFIKSFSWGGKTNSPIYHLDKALEVVRIVMSRRNKKLLPEEEELIRAEFERTNKKKN